MKLVLCAGSRLTEGYVHHDVKPLPGIDIVCDLKDLSIPEGSCERIEFTHALEHFPATETVPLLKKIKSWLAKDGELYIEVPNFEWHASLLLKEGRYKDAIYYAFGGQEDEYDLHKTGFTKEILHDALLEAGFSNVEIWNQSSLIAKAYNK